MRGVSAAVRPVLLLYLALLAIPCMAVPASAEAACSNDAQWDLPADWRLPLCTSASAAASGIPQRQPALSASSNRSLLHGSASMAAGLPTATITSLIFELLTDQAPWPPRYRGYAGLWARPLTFSNEASYRPQTFPKALVLLGGQHQYGGVNGVNDVWASSDGLRWYLIAGRSNGGQAADEFADTSFVNLFHGAQFSSPLTNAFYRLGGFTIAGYSDSTAAWSSADGGKTWTDLSESLRNPVSTRWSQAAANSQGHILLVGGVDESVSPNYNNLDVWLWPYGGRSWVVSSAAPPFGVRLFATVNAWTIPGGGPDVFLVIGGRDNADNHNDVWSSSDNGKSWVAITKAAPWAQRCYHSTIVTKDGLLLVIAGRGDTAPGFGTAAALNDVQLSVDGGYSCQHLHSPVPASRSGRDCLLGSLLLPHPLSSYRVDLRPRRRMGGPRLSERRARCRRAPARDGGTVDGCQRRKRVQEWSAPHHTLTLSQRPRDHPPSSPRFADLLMAVIVQMCGARRCPSTTWTRSARRATS